MSWGAGGPSPFSPLPQLPQAFFRFSPMGFIEYAELGLDALDALASMGHNLYDKLPMTPRSIITPAARGTAAGGGGTAAAALDALSTMGHNLYDKVRVERGGREEAWCYVLPPPSLRSSPQRCALSSPPLRRHHAALPLTAAVSHPCQWSCTRRSERESIGWRSLMSRRCTLKSNTHSPLHPQSQQACKRETSVSTRHVAHHGSSGVEPLCQIVSQSPLRPQLLLLPEVPCASPLTRAYCRGCLPLHGHSKGTWQQGVQKQQILLPLRCSRRLEVTSSHPRHPSRAQTRRHPHLSHPHCPKPTPPPQRLSSHHQRHSHLKMRSQKPPAVVVAAAVLQQGSASLPRVRAQQHAQMRPWQRRCRRQRELPRRLRTRGRRQTRGQQLSHARVWASSLKRVAVGDGRRPEGRGRHAHQHQAQPHPCL